MRKHFVKKSSGLLVSLSMSSSLLSGALVLQAKEADPVFTSASSSNSIAIVHTNDVHCGGLLAAEKDGVYSAIGYNGVLAATADLESQYGQENVTLVDAGDAIQGQPIGTLSKGEDIIDIMNEAGYDIAVPGNHEFDYGIDQLNSLRAQADFPYVSCNVQNTQSNEPLFDGYTTEEYTVNGNTVTVAYVGVTTPTTLTSESPVIFENAQGETIYSFYGGDNGQTLYNQVQATVNAASKEADYVVAITHLGSPASSSIPEEYTSTALIQNTTGIDAVIDGHSHEIYNEQVENKDGQKVSLAQCGTQLEAYGTMILTPDATPGPEDFKSNVYQAKELSEVPVAESMTEYIEGIQKELDQQLNVVIGKNEVPLSFLQPNGKGDPWWYCARMHESNLGDFVADAYATRLDAQIGLVNGGGIRWNTIEFAIEPGDLTYGDMIQINPYANTLSKATISGQDLLDALEYSVRSLTPAFDDSTEAEGGFLQVSGISFDADVSIPSPIVLDENGDFQAVSGTRRVSNVKVGNEALDPNKTYTLGTSTYLLEGGSGYTMLKNATITQHNTGLDYEALIDYLQQDLKGVINQGYENAQGQGRINLLVGTPHKYADVPENDWYTPAADFLYYKNIMTGYNANTFAPNARISRAQFVTILYRYLNPDKATESAAGTKNSTPFRDVADGLYYTPAINWAYEKGLVTGMSPDLFAPAAPINCQQMTLILYRTFGDEKPGDSAILNDFKDSTTISDYALEGMIWALNEDVINGSNGYIYPKDDLSRARAATILYNGIINTVFN